MKIPTRWLVLLVMILGAMAIPIPGLSPAHGSPQEHTFRVDASRFRFEPGTLAVNPGDRVTLELRATDVVHGLYLDGYGLSVIADPGQTATLSFVADRAGSFRFRCSVPCGDIHPFMLGRLRVGPNWLLIRSIGLALVVAVWGVISGAASRRPVGRVPA